VEHLTDISVLSRRTGITDTLALSQLVDYAKSIYIENLKYNLTGHKNLPDIIENLIIGSLEPIKHLDVPRGTLFADIGTGSGIPGVPIALKYRDCRGILFDSNQKKIRFINKTASDLGINNVIGIDIRVEDAGRSDEYRETFDFVFTRAMSDLFTIAELGSPLLKTGGYIYLYINKNQVVFNDYISDHLDKVGLSLLNETELDGLSGIDLNEGLLLKKFKPSDNTYPRRIAVIKRLAVK